MIKLRKYQKVAVAAAFDYIKNNKGKHPVIGLPTGSGKSFIIAEIVRRTLKWNAKVLVLSHNAEILQQDYDSINNYLDDYHCNYDIGINSASLGRREFANITVAGIQSVYKQPHKFKDIKLVIIDEAHTINNREGSMYDKFFAGLNGVIYLGLTATCYRLGAGYIYGPGKLFDDIVIDYTSGEQFVRLVKDGYLCPLITKQTKMELNTTGVKTIAGDFSEKSMSLKFDRDSITDAAIDEIIKAGANRKAWLIFAIDIKHCEHIAERLLQKGILTNVVHSRMEFDRAKVIQDFKDEVYKCIVNVNVLTTGFDNPKIDLIAMLRPTKSPVLHVQSIGRGLRVSPGKENCLVLDFAGNTKRNGPINNIEVYTKRKSGVGDPPTKTCPVCDSIVALSTRICPDCEHEFIFEHHLSDGSGGEEIVQMQTGRWHDIDKIEYIKHDNGRTPPSIKVIYHSGLLSFQEWVCVSHTGYAKHKANHFLKFREGDIPVEGILNDIDKLLEISNTLLVPNRIFIDSSKKYGEVVDYAF